MSAQRNITELGRAIDDLLVAHHGLKHCLAPDHLPFTATFAEATQHYGDTPTLHLWNECRLVQNLINIWVGSGSITPAEAARPE